MDKARFWIREYTSGPAGLRIVYLFDDARHVISAGPHQSGPIYLGAGKSHLIGHTMTEADAMDIAVWFEQRKMETAIVQRAAKSAREHIGDLTPLELLFRDLQEFL